MLLALLFAQAMPPLELTCGGGGVANRADTATVYGAENSGSSAWPTAHASHREPFEGQADIRIAGQDGRIRLPQNMLPAIQTGDGGWFALKNLKVTDGSITGSAAVNLMNAPKVHIDRNTGTIRIDGRAGSFDGRCQAGRG
jgi:hypothetical protein